MPKDKRDRLGDRRCHLSPILSTVGAALQPSFSCGIDVFRLSRTIGEAASFAAESARRPCPRLGRTSLRGRRKAARPRQSCPLVATVWLSSASSAVRRCSGRAYWHRPSKALLWRDRRQEQSASCPVDVLRRLAPLLRRKELQSTALPNRERE